MSDTSINPSHQDKSAVQPSGNHTPIVQVHNVNQRFRVGEADVQVLSGVNFGIDANSFTIIFGASGSGKSTLLNIIAGLQHPSEGIVQLRGDDVYKLHPDDLARFRANKIGFVQQSNYWINSLNVLENVSMPLFFLGYSRAKAAKLSMLALERVKMVEYAKKSPLLLSSGEQQRIAMARALVNDPLLIIADEPTGSLDTKNGDSIIDILLESQTEFKRTIILVTHNMEYISLADNLLQISDGQVKTIAKDKTADAAGTVMQEVRDRIDHLSKVKQHAASK